VFFSVFSKNPGNSTLCLERVKKMKKSKNFTRSKSKIDFSGNWHFFYPQNELNWILEKKWKFRKKGEKNVKKVQKKASAVNRKWTKRVGNAKFSIFFTFWRGFLAKGCLGGVLRVPEAVWGSKQPFGRFRGLKTVFWRPFGVQTAVSTVPRPQNHENTVFFGFRVLLAYCAYD